MKKRRNINRQNKRVTGLPLDAKLIAEATMADGMKTVLYAGKDGAIYAQRLEKVTYQILGGKV